MYGHVTDPGKLWNETQDKLTEDILFNEKRRLNDPNFKINDKCIIVHYIT